MRAQVVCPGVVRSEFHTRQGLDMSEVPRMEPASVVQASLADLERGVVVSIPGAEDDSALRAIEAASAALAPSTRTVELPDRYRSEKNWFRARSVPESRYRNAVVFELRPKDGR